MAQLKSVKSISSLKKEQKCVLPGFEHADVVFFVTEITTVATLKFAAAAVALINMSVNQCRH